jgi:general secretion pathway protein M
MTLAMPTGSRGKALALGMLGVLVIVLWFGAASPLVALFRERQDNLDRRIALADKMSNVANLLPSLRSRTAALERLARQPGWLLPGMSDALAGARLQEMLSRAASTSGTVILSLESMPTGKVGALRRIALHLTISGKYAALIEFLAAIEQENPHLFIDYLQLQGSMDQANENANLVANVTVSAFRRGSA